MQDRYIQNVKVLLGKAVTGLGAVAEREMSMQGKFPRCYQGGGTPEDGGGRASHFPILYFMCTSQLHIAAACIMYIRVQSILGTAV